MPDRELIDLTIIERERIRAHIAAGLLPPESQVRALWRAYEEQEQDLAALRCLLTMCQEQRALTRAWRAAKSTHEFDEAAHRVDQQWAAIASYLETLALNVPSPGAAVAAQLANLKADLVIERDGRRRAEGEIEAARVAYAELERLQHEDDCRTPRPL